MGLIDFVESTSFINLHTVNVGLIDFVESTSFINLQGK